MRTAGAGAVVTATAALAIAIAVAVTALATLTTALLTSNRNGLPRSRLSWPRSCNQLTMSSGSSTDKTAAKTAIIIVDHGSRKKEANDMLLEVDRP